jgi:hypothetical protein
MPAIDPGAAQIMNLSSELVEAKATIRRQRRALWALVAALRAQQVAGAALMDLSDILLAEATDD